MKAGPVHSNLPASLIEFCRMQRMLSAGVIEFSDTVGEAPSSTQARWVNGFHSLNESRTDRVEQIREQLRQGSYDTDGKLDVALNRMIDRWPRGLNDHV